MFETDAILPESFRDPSGFMFRSRGELFRAITRRYQAAYERLMNSGLYQELVRNQLLIPHEEVSEAFPDQPECYRTIKPETVEFISYPHEWCFSQLKDAALTTLMIQKTALEFGMSLKDASAYNIQFHNGRPVLIDTLSFEEYRAGEPWVAYRQFCQHFLAPLTLMSHTDVRLGQLLRVHIDGIPLDLTCRLLPQRTKLSLGLGTHLHLHARSQRRYAAKTEQVKTGKVSRLALQGIISSLESAVQGLHYHPAGTEWADYYDMTNYSPSAFAAKQDVVRSYLHEIRPHTLWDLGANTGLFSRLAAEQGILTIAGDIDPAAVERAYLECRQHKEKHLLPLVLDLTNPSPALGWENQERKSLLARGPADAVMALALIHHLAIGNNLPLRRIAHFFAGIGRYLVIEFVPKNDSQVQRLLTTREDIFPDYTEDGFESGFRTAFNILDRHALTGSARTLYLMERRPPVVPLSPDAGRS